MHFHTIQNKTAQIIQWLPTVLLYLRTNIILTILITKLAPISLQCNKTGIGWLTLFSGNRTQVKYPSMSQKWPKIKPFHFFNSFLTSVSNKQLFIFVLCSLRISFIKTFKKKTKSQRFIYCDPSILVPTFLETMSNKFYTRNIFWIFLSHLVMSIFLPCYSNIYSSI